jgi:hypothetical protein
MEETIGGMTFKKIEGSNLYEITSFGPEPTSAEMVEWESEMTPQLELYLADDAQALAGYASADLLVDGLDRLDTNTQVIDIPETLVEQVLDVLQAAHEANGFVAVGVWLGGFESLCIEDPDYRLGQQGLAILFDELKKLAII